MATEIAGPCILNVYHVVVVVVVVVVLTLFRPKFGNLQEFGNCVGTNDVDSDKLDSYSSIAPKAPVWAE